MLMVHKCRLLFVILLCICLNQMALGLSCSPGEKASTPVQLVKAPITENRSKRVSLESVLNYVQDEPIILLLLGLALFAGAATLRRRRSVKRERSHRSIETSV